MHILLLVLKIIGIVLLVVLGLLLFLILLLLLVPFCYRAEGSFNEDKPYAMVRIRYLFPLLNVFIKYQEEKLEGKVKLFGLTVYDFFPTGEETEKKTKDKVAKKKKAAESEAPKENVVESEQEKQTESQVNVETNTLTDAQQEDEKMPLWEKLRLFVRTLKEKILSFIQKMKAIRDKGIEIKEKVSHYYEIWRREETQRAFGTAKKTLYKVWKSIRPKKGLVKFHFGTGDPGSTGQMCGYLGMLYPFIGKYVMIEPDFENKIYEGDFYLKGRITLFVFLRAAWTILFDKDIKTLRKILMNS